jgi:S1-C subfamily serine protease
VIRPVVAVLSSPCTGRGAIVGIGGREVPDARALNFRLAMGEIGGSAELRVRRNGTALDLELPLETPPYEPAPEVSRLELRRALAGAAVTNLSPGLIRDLGRDMFEAGVIMLEVDRAAPAGRLRLRRGDLIRTLADEPIDEVAELRTVLRERRPPWRIEVERDGRRLAVVLGG